MKRLVLAMVLVVFAGVSGIAQGTVVPAPPTSGDDMWMNGACLDGCWNGSIGCYDACELYTEGEYRCHMECNEAHIECRNGCRVIFGGGGL